MPIFLSTLVVCTPYPRIITSICNQHRGIFTHLMLQSPRTIYKYGSSKSAVKPQHLTSKKLFSVRLCSFTRPSLCYNDPEKCNVEFLAQQLYIDSYSISIGFQKIIDCVKNLVAHNTTAEYQESQVQAKSLSMNHRPLDKYFKAQEQIRNQIINSIFSDTLNDHKILIFVLRDSNLTII